MVLTLSLIPHTMIKIFTSRAITMHNTFLQLFYTGSWYMTSSDNMEEVLPLLGTGPCTAAMVLQANMMLSLQEDIDFGWWIRYEYYIKGKSPRGYKARAHKMTSNKFIPECEKLELIEDWDKRYYYMYRYMNMCVVIYIECISKFTSICTIFSLISD